ncbi:MAG TPA: hypothetical protein ENI99_01665 [Sedimenticola sp.]|nr:hypothetical protein [Sedimenticola sp.]
MQKSIRPLSAIAFSTLLMAAGPLHAAGNHSHDHGKDDGHKHDSGMNHGKDDGHKHDSAMDKMFLKKKQINGYTVTFHVMKAKPGKEMGGSHDFMIKVEKGGQALKNIVMNTKVVHPDGKAETKKTMKMGDWLMAGYDLGHPGRHQLMILFKTPDGKKHKGGVYYPGG